MAQLVEQRIRNAWVAGSSPAIGSDMAQLVEQRIRNAWVAGSSPAIGSLFCKKSQQSHLWILTLFLFLRI